MSLLSNVSCSSSSCLSTPRLMQTRFSTSDVSKSICCQLDTSTYTMAYHIANVILKLDDIERDGAVYLLCNFQFLSTLDATYSLLDHSGCPDGLVINNTPNILLGSVVLTSRRALHSL